MTLLEYRHKHGLTQAAVAAAIDAAVTTVSGYENGCVPTPAFMDRIVAFTKKAVTPNDFHGVSSS